MRFWKGFGGKNKRKSRYAQNHLANFEYIKPLLNLKWKNRFNCIAAHFRNEIIFFF